MKRIVLFTASHLLVLAFGFALGIYLLPTNEAFHRVKAQSLQEAFSQFITAARYR